MGFEVKERRVEQWGRRQAVAALVAAGWGAESWILESSSALLLQTREW